jgi:hypothetical protein
MRRLIAFLAFRLVRLVLAVISAAILASLAVKIHERINEDGDIVGARRVFSPTEPN